MHEMTSQNMEILLEPWKVQTNDPINEALKVLEVKAKKSESIIQKLYFIENIFDHLNAMQSEVNIKNQVIEDITLKVKELEQRTLKWKWILPRCLMRKLM